MRETKLSRVAVQQLLHVRQRWVRPGIHVHMHFRQAKPRRLTGKQSQFRIALVVEAIEVVVHFERTQPRRRTAQGPRERPSCLGPKSLVDQEL